MKKLIILACLFATLSVAASNPPEVTEKVLRKELGSKDAQENHIKNLVGEVKEKAIDNKITLDIKYNVISKSVLSVTATFADVTFTGSSNTPVEYAMLQGLQKGQNYLLNVSFDRKLSNFLEMTVSYEGRKTGIASVIHTGQAQIRALF